MKLIRLAILLIFAVATSSCSFGYEIIILNDSDIPIVIRYKIKEKAMFRVAETMTLAEWNERKSWQFWNERKQWSDCLTADQEIVQGVKEIRLAPKHAVRIEEGNYNPIREREGNLPDITELEIRSKYGELSYSGRLLLSQFEKDGYTFVKTFKYEPKD